MTPACKINTINYHSHVWIKGIAMIGNIFYENLKKAGCVLFAAVFAGFLPPAFANSNLSAQEQLVVAGVNANWGPPSPYLHVKKGAGYAISMFVFDTLVWRGENGDLVPATALRWEIGADLKSFHFYLDPKAKWHDGKALTAKDVAFTIDYMRNHPYALVNTQAISRVEVVNTHEVIFHTQKSFPPFMSSIAPALPILPEHVFSGVDNPVEFTEKGAFVGSGPYRLKTHDRVNKSYVFTAFNDYHRGKPRVQEIKIIATQAPAVVKNAQSTKIDMITTVAPKQERALEKAGFKLLHYPTVHPVRLKFNLEKPLFQSIKTRQAFARGIDRQAIVDKAYQGRAQLWSAGGLHSLKDDQGDSEIMQYDYHPDSLKGIVPAGTRLKLITDKRMQKAAQVIAAQFKQSGIEIDVTVNDRSAANAIFRQGDFDLGLVSFSILGDPMIFREVEIGNHMDSDRYLANDRLTQLLNDQTTEADPEKRARMVREASIIYSQDVPSVSLVSMIRTVAYRPQVLYLKWHGGGIGRGIPSLLDRDFFAAPFQ